MGKGYVFRAYSCAYSDNGEIHLCKYVLTGEGISMSLLLVTGIVDSLLIRYGSCQDCLSAIV